MKAIEIKKQNPNWEFPDFEAKELFPKKSKYCICVFVINEGERIRKQLRAMKGFSSQIDIVVADGDSTDGSLDINFLKNQNVRALLVKKGKGKLSAQMRMAFAWALAEGYEGIVVVDGNGKDDVSAIPDFIRLLDEGYDHIQGSRFIPGGQAINTPLSREVGLHLLHAPLISFAARRRHTDTTNGFRAYSAHLLLNDEIAVFRDVFQTYELHYYLAIESSRRKQYKTIETPVTRAYPKHSKAPTKISPLKGNAHVLAVLFKTVVGAYKKDKSMKKGSRWLWMLGALSIIGAIVSAVIFYPGYMSTDSIDQLEQTLGHKEIYDWHPPVMVLVWKVLIYLTGHISAMLLLQLSLLWTALFLLSIFTYEITRSKKASVLPLLVGLLPCVLNISGVIWKDCQMAFSLLLSTVGIVYLAKYKLNVYAKYSIAAGTGLLILYAYLLRYNAIVAILPLVYALFNIGLKLNIKKSLIGCGGFLLIALMSGMTVNAITHAKQTHPLSAVMIDDITNVLSVHEIQHSTSSVYLKDALVNAKRICGHKKLALNVSGLCFSSDARLNISTNYYKELKNLWIKTIMGNTWGYIGFRVQAFSGFIFVPESYSYYWQKGIQPNGLNLKVKNERYGFATETYVKGFGYEHFSFLFKPWFWLFLNGCLIWLFLKRWSKFVQMRIALVLNISSVVYIFAYIPDVIGFDYRYIYWSVLATIVSLILIFPEFRKMSKRDEPLKGMR